MKELLYRLILVFAVAISACTGVQAASGDLFIYPTAPDTMQRLQPRCDYIVTRFWDRCNFGTAFRAPQRLNAAFGDWVEIMPHATADTVYAAVDRLIKRFEKKGPEILALAEMAENWLYSDTARIISPEVYLPFAKAAATHKKIDKASRARYAAQVKVIESSSVGANVPAVPVIYADGTKGTFDQVQGGSILMFFNDPDCMDCTLARIRLSADPNTRELIERGELTVASIYAGDTEDEGWEKARADADPAWRVMAMPTADEYFDLSATPAFYFLNSRHKVLASQMDIDYLLNAFRIANTAAKSRAAEQ